MVMRQMVGLGKGSMSLGDWYAPLFRFVLPLIDEGAQRPTQIRVHNGRSIDGTLALCAYYWYYDRQSVLEKLFGCWDLVHVPSASRFYMQGAHVGKLDAARSLHRCGNLVERRTSRKGNSRYSAPFFWYLLLLFFIRALRA